VVCAIVTFFKNTSYFLVFTILSTSTTLSTTYVPSFPVPLMPDDSPLLMVYQQQKDTTNDTANLLSAQFEVFELPIAERYMFLPATFNC